MPEATVKFGFTYNQLIQEGFPIETFKVEEVRKWLTNDGLPKLTDEQILHFLLSCDSDVDFTKVTIKTYVRLKYSGNDVFSNRKYNDDKVQKAFATSSVCVCPQRTPEGYAIIFFGFKNHDYWNWNLTNAVKTILMAIDCSIYQYPAKGLIILVDLQKLSLGHLFKLNPRTLKFFFDYLQEALPVKLRHVHLLNSTSILNQLLAIIKPLMHKDLFEKIDFHPKDLDWNMFYDKFLSRQFLCEDFGGDLPSIQTLEEQTIKKIIDMEEYFDMEELSRSKI